MRLIDADALKVDWRDDYETEDGDEYSYPYVSQYQIDNAPTIDVMPVVTHLTNNAPTIDVIPHWIPCEERLPEYFDYVLLSSSKYGLKIGARTRKSNFNSWYFNEPLDCDVWHVTLSDNWYNFEDFTAWMPLPEPYVEERKNNE